MTLILRPLTENDFGQVADVVNGHDRFMLGNIDKAFFLKQYAEQLKGVRLASLGVFKAGVLDAFLLWRYTGPSPRADDPTRTDPVASYSYSTWSRKRPDREKTETGHDVAQGLLTRGQLEVLKGYGVYTTWSFQPSQWRVYTQNPQLADVMAQWTRRDMAVWEPGRPASGVAADFVQRYIAGGPNPHPYSLTARAITLRDEFR